MERKDIDKKYKWDLDSIYKNEEEINADLKKCEDLTKKIEKFEGKVIKSSKNLLKVLELDDNLDRILSKISCYVGLNYALNLASSFWSDKNDKFSDFYSQLSARLSFVETELSKLTSETLDKFLKEEKNLEKYKFNLEHIIKESEHILSLESEKLLSNLSPVLGAAESIL